MSVMELLLLLGGQLVVLLGAIWSLFRHVLRPTIDSWIDERNVALTGRVRDLEKWRSKWDSELSHLRGVVETRMDYADKSRVDLSNEIIALRRNIHDLRNWLMTQGRGGREEGD